MIDQHITLCGSFGFGNAGDEALPLAFEDLAKGLGINLKTSLLTRYDSPDLKNSIGLGPLDRKRREALRNTPLFVTGGGIIEPVNHCVVLRCASFLKNSFTPVSALFGASVEPGVSYPLRSRIKLFLALRSVKRLYVRDELSYQVLRGLLPFKRIKVIGDMVLSMEAEKSLPDIVQGLHRYIAVTLAPRWDEDPQWYPWIAHQLARLSRALNASLVFVPMSVLQDDDRPVHNAVSRLIREADEGVQTVCIEEILGPRQVAAVLKKAVLTVGMRLHGCVISYAQRTPYIGLMYHPKIYGFSKTVGWEHSVVPQMPVIPQSEKNYGYSFSDDLLKRVDLTDTAVKVMERGSFDALDHYRQQQREAFAELIGLHVSY